MADYMLGIHLKSIFPFMLQLRYKLVMNISKHERISVVISLVKVACVMHKSHR